jgi:GxxExxY protein
MLESHFRCEVALPVDTKIFCSMADIGSISLVRGELIMEIKGVEALLPIHQAQILTYMRLAHLPLGLIINFNVTRLQSGIKRLVL